MSEVRIIECSSHPKTYPLAPISFDITDNFKITWNFLNNLGDSTGVRLNNLEVQFDFFTKGNPDHFFARNADSYNCTQSGTSITCIMQDHGLKPGLLYCNITVLYPDPDFTSEKSSIVETKFLGIELTDISNAFNFNSGNATAVDDLQWEYDI